MTQETNTQMTYSPLLERLVIRKNGAEGDEVKVVVGEAIDAAPGVVIASF